MKIKKTFFSTLFLLFSISSFSQDYHTLIGRITDFKTNESLRGVNIFSPEANIKTSTDNYGFYSIKLPQGEHTLKISSIGYYVITKKINLKKDTELDFNLTKGEEALFEIVVKNKTTLTPAGTIELSISTIKKIPAVLGEVDILKSILLLPGVTNAGEGSAGFNVRGGGTDQNLILLDESPIFNPSHAFGFFSVFNSDIIKDLKLYKSGIPANYGGRIASLLDINQKSGNYKKLNVQGGIGVISSRLLLEGPILKDKISFLIGARTTYAHLFLKLLEEQKNNSIYFYDFNAKINYKINSNNNIYISSYLGRDLFKLNNSFTNEYGNTTLNLKWHHQYSKKMNSNLSFSYSDYFYNLNLHFISVNWNSNITNYTFKYAFKNQFSSKFKLNYGLETNHYLFNPGTLKYIDKTTEQLEEKMALEHCYFINAEHDIFKNIKLSYGLRQSIFYHLGPAKVNLYENNSPVIFNTESKIYEKAIPTGIQDYSTNKIIKSYNNLEPRISFSYQLNDNNSINTSYNRTSQYLHLISNTSSPTPLDVWMPSDRYIKPQIGDQIAFGYSKIIKNDYSLQFDVYYKKLKNRLDYIDGADLIANKAIEQVLLKGQMRSYGLEILAKKNRGKLNGWISYTLSKSEKQTTGRTPEETGINNGEWYNSVYDKPHNLAITASYDISKRWTLGSNFVYQTGQATTFPRGQYKYLDISAPIYGSRNKDRLPNYHHLDFSATLKPSTKSTGNWQGEWVFSIYNIYNRKNASSINFRQNIDTGNNEAIKTSIFGFVPAITYNFKF
ncbi:TonB-dependent receptor [Flavobacterium sp. NG2]|uniref:TonB-dependent receptor n=1 Tax=Flavobacterium sp. NG2 TaxID=3097547 RepID=UPI002A837DDF|nr:TonB-dependent receptor [Flavobacterium sp. NG2]WPR71224.1 TonB-dependent receptor [Flavobacterium sp. NG2]